MSARAKTWTYRQLTQLTEEQLQGFIQLASDTNDCDEVRVYRCMANGAWALWNNITCGWQAERGVSERLEALCDSVGKRPTVAEKDRMARFNRRTTQTQTVTP